jgi:hypothetical protein
MVRKPLLAGVVLAFMSAPALAFHCPADIAAIDNALGKVELGAEQRGQVEALRDEGRALHDAGDHTASVNKLAEAMRIILNNL